MKIKATNPYRKKARKGFRGYPAATVAFYGPDDQFASKVSVAILLQEDDGLLELRRWFAEKLDVRTDPATTKNIWDFMESHGVKTVVVTDSIIGCPHEEVIDYPEGKVCPKCPFWAHRNRWAGEPIQ